MKTLIQNKQKLVDVEQVILIMKGGPYNQEIEIRDLDSSIVLATYSHKEKAFEVFENFREAKKRIYKLEHAKELLSQNEIKNIIDHDYIFEFPE